jgi:hypothetical protein
VGPKNAVARRYMRRMTVSMVAYVGSLLAAVYLIQIRNVSGAPAWALAFVPGLAAVGMLYAVARLIQEQTDEFLRMLLVRQNMIATGFALSLATVWGFLEMFGLVPHVEAFYIIVLWAFGSLVGAVSNRITHGSWGSCW